MRLPAARHWLGFAALFQLGAFAFAAIVGLLGMNPVPPTWFYVLLAVAAVLTVLAWHAAAKQAEESETYKLDAALNRKVLETLAESSRRELPTGLENLTRLSESEIRKRVKDLADRMRAFESNYLAQDRARFMTRTHVGMDQEARQKAWDAETRDMVSHHHAAQTEFRSRFLPEAIQLRDEMQRRLGLFAKNEAERSIVALEYGMLAGVRPIDEAAGYLEGLARKLP